MLFELKQTIIDNGWEITVIYPFIFCKLNPKNHPEKLFMIRLKCVEYPNRAPSLQFVDIQTRKEGIEYWPKEGDAFKAAVQRAGFQLCIEGIREFYEGCHSSPADQKKYPWDPLKFPFSNIILNVQNLLNQAYP